MKKTTGTYSFTTEINYDLFDTGDDALFIYLHGYMQNKYMIRRKMEEMMELRGKHIFLNAPYPVYDSSRSRPVEKWGRAWYLYDGIQAQFLKSLEETSGNLELIIDDLCQKHPTDKICLLGYSMGAYQVGFYMLSRPDKITHGININGRIKTEAFTKEQLRKASHISVLALHGSEDHSVYPDPQRKEIEKLRAHGFDAEFNMPECGHDLEAVFSRLSKDWLLKKGYKK